MTNSWYTRFSMDTTDLCGGRVFVCLSVSDRVSLLRFGGPGVGYKSWVRNDRVFPSTRSLERRIVRLAIWSVLAT